MWAFLLFCITWFPTIILGTIGLLFIINGILNMRKDLVETQEIEEDDLEVKYNIPPIPFLITFSDGYVMEVTKMEEKGVYMNNEWSPVFQIEPNYPLVFGLTSVSLEVLHVLMTAGSVLNLTN